MLKQILSSLSTPELFFLLLIFLYNRTYFALLSLYADERMYCLNGSICNIGAVALKVHSGLHKGNYYILEKR